jgi:tetratricopeptide (TPR) repeat protein
MNVICLLSMKPCLDREKKPIRTLYHLVHRQDRSLQVVRFEGFCFICNFAYFVKSFKFNPLQQKPVRKITFVALIVFLTFSSCEVRSTKELFHEACKYENLGNFQEAILLLNKAVQQDSTYLPAYINLGADESTLGRYQAAIDHYSTAIRLSPANTLALLNRGRNKSRLGNYRAALEDFQRAVNSKGCDSFWVDIHLKNGDYDCSMPEILLERGIAYYNIDSLKKAFHDFKFCIASQYEPGIAYRFCGFIYISTGDKDWGCKFLQKAAELGDADAVKNIAKYCN